MAYGDNDPFTSYSLWDLTDRNGMDSLGDDDNEGGYDPVDADARAKAKDIDKNANKGGVDVSGQGITNTATFPGSDGNTYGYPSPVPSPTGTTSVTDPGPPMPGAKPSNYIDPLLFDTKTASVSAGPSGTLSDKDRVVRDAAGNIVGVRDASGYYSGNDWAGYDNIINNAQRGDPFAIDKVAALARLGDARALTVLGSTPGIGPDYKLGADVGNNSIFGSATFEDWRRQHNAEVGKNFGNTYANQPQGTYGGQRQMNPIEGGNQPNEKIYDNWAGVSLKDITKMMEATGRSYKGIDDYGNVHFQGTDGTQKVMPWWDAKNQVTKLYDDYVAANPKAPPGGGGGRPPYTGGGGGGGGTTTQGGGSSTSDGTNALSGTAAALGSGAFVGVGASRPPYSPFQYQNPSDMQPYPNGAPPAPYSPFQWQNNGAPSTGGPAINPMTGTLDPGAPPSMQGTYAPPPNRSGNGFLPPEDSPAYNIWNGIRNRIGGTGADGWGGMGPGWWSEDGVFHPG